MADFNGDRIPDLAAGDVRKGRILVWYGGPRVTWKRPIALKTDGEVRDLAAIDLNGDGLSDIAYSLRGTPGGVYTLISAPAEKAKWRAGTPAALEGLYEGLSVADVNGDGKWDLAAANGTAEQNGGVQVFLGDGRGGWLGEFGPTRGGIFRDVKLVDLNGDGRTDLAAAGWGSGSGLRVWLQREKGGGWKGLPLIAQGNYWGVWASDLNRDGRIDLAATTFQNGVRVYWGKGDGRFEKGKSPVRDGSFWRVRSADMNGDGAPDLLATSIDGGGVRLWLNDGSGRWEADPRYLPKFGVFYGLEVRDIDRDGKLDVTVASRQDGVKVWLRGPTAPFANSGLPKGLARAAAVARMRHDVRNGADAGARPVRKAVSSGRPPVPDSKSMSRLHPGLLYPANAVNGPSSKRKGPPSAAKVIPPVSGVKVARAGLAGRSDRFQGGAVRVKGEGSGFPDGTRVAQATGRRRRPISAGKEGWEPPGKAKSYRIGVGDKLVINIWRGLVADANRVLVDEEGKIGFTFLKNVQAAGLTATQLDASLSRLLRKFIKRPRLDLRVMEFRSQSYTMLGEVGRQGRFPIMGPIRVFDAVITAGGSRPGADIKGTRVLRRGKAIPVALNKIFDGDQRTNILLEHGDQILVPKLDIRRGAIRVVGQVPKQGSYPVGEDLRVLDAVLMAGCCRRVSSGDPLPDIRRARVIRKGRIIPVNLDEVILRGDQRQNIVLKDGDQVIIPGEPRGSLTVVGEIRQPGRYKIEGRTQLLDVILLAGGHRDAADLTQVKIFRGGQTILVNLAQVIFQGDAKQNIVIRDGDQIVVPSLPAERQRKLKRDRRIYALGELKSPGSYTFRPDVQNLSLLDVLTRAGGFTKFAVGSSAKIIRGDIERPVILSADIDRLLEKG
ncbi:MAG TPA: FG-GAP-like repeat-containing protein, partial [Nitrospinota bacterium]|nr:FG-GAP-like repeat-containing protein [Nitrospinota bacterium]